jgi:hypothetical protein
MCATLLHPSQLAPSDLSTAFKTSLRGELTGVLHAVFVRFSFSLLHASEELDFAGLLRRKDQRSRL